MAYVPYADWFTKTDDREWVVMFTPTFHVGVYGTFLQTREPGDEGQLLPTAFSASSQVVFSSAWGKPPNAFELTDKFHTYWIELKAKQCLFQWVSLTRRRAALRALHRVAPALPNALLHSIV